MIRVAEAARPRRSRLRSQSPLRAQYRARLAALLGGLESLEAATLERATRELARLRADLVRTIVRQRPDSRGGIDSSTLLREVDAFLGPARLRLAALLGASGAQALRAGALMVDGVFRPAAAALDPSGRLGAALGGGGGGLPSLVEGAAGADALPDVRVEGVFPLVPAGLIEATAALAAEEVTTLTQRFRGRMATAIRRAALGGLTIAEAMAEVDRLLPEDERGPRLTDDIGYAAERIVRTQLNRAFNGAASARLADFARDGERAGIRVGALEKEWIATADARTRPAHLAAHGQRVAAGEKFRIEDPLTGAVEELEYPGDPQGSAANVINCRCRMVTVYPDVLFD